MEKKKRAFFLSWKASSSTGDETEQMILDMYSFLYNYNRLWKQTPPKSNLFVIGEPAQLANLDHRPRLVI